MSATSTPSRKALRDVDIVFNAAALKQVPTCEYFPYEAVRTNIEGPENIIRAIQENGLPIETVVGVSTDKACKPVKRVGMTKASAGTLVHSSKYPLPENAICLRALRQRARLTRICDSTLPRSDPQWRPDYHHHTGMTRFLLSLNDAVDVIFAAVETGLAGETYIPRVPSALVTHLATALVGNRPIETKIVGYPPREKEHEILVSEEEAHRTVERGAYYAILPLLPELRRTEIVPAGLTKEYSSADDVMTLEETTRLLTAEKTDAFGCRSPNSPRFSVENHDDLGTRPEIIRLSLLIRLLDQNCEHTLVDTGQNYDDRLSALVFFGSLKFARRIYRSVRVDRRSASRSPKFCRKSNRCFARNRLTVCLFSGTPIAGYPQSSRSAWGFPFFTWKLESLLRLFASPKKAIVESSTT